MYSPLKSKSFAIALLTTLTRHYNYALFGLSASLLAEEFFPGTNSTQMFGFFIVFTISTCSRTIGAIIFGSISDKISRVYNITLTSLIALFSILMITFLPPYNMLGAGSIILLTISRAVFLATMSGGGDAIKIFATELAGKNHRYLAIALVTSSSQIGVLFASFMYYVAVTHLDFQWIWRMNFLLGGVLFLIVLLARNYMQESTEFLESKAINSPDQSLSELINTHKVQFALATIINGLLGAGYHFMIIFLNNFLSYSVEVITLKTASIYNMLLITTYCILSPMAGYFSEYFKSKKQSLYAISISLSLVLMLMFIDYNNVIYIELAIIMCTPFYFIPCTILIQSLFHTSIRARMCSLAHAIGSLLFSSSAPLMSMVIWNNSGSTTLVISYFALILSALAISVTAALRLR